MAVHRNVRRAAVPVAVVAGVAAVGAGVWPAIASDGGPDLPDVTAEELVVRVVQSETEQLSGTVRVEADLGLPDLGPMLDGVLDGAGPAGRLAGLATGDSTLRVAMDGPERQRVALADGSDEFAVIRNGDDLWAYDSAGDTVLHATAPAEAREAAPFAGLTPQEAAERLLAAAGEHADISVDGTSRVAGRTAYQLTVEPTDASSGVSLARLAVDSETGVPLAVSVTSERGSLDIAFSQIDYTQPAGSVFDFTPPSGAEVVEIDPETGLEGLLSGLGPDVTGDLPFHDGQFEGGFDPEELDLSELLRG
ncbi:LolA family protein [Streptomyces millisiae]|uniref:Sigma-E factor regulatory protein RseB domain-containing protein n=1 Tax=Streptomyces millisiae TaxID=3075542 RepID=A0ABU2LTJ3_9ACTN|nr:sigma-E factor regulatory protein RseB domain-containing protein [Streptomyces sp. DSM 44918]MDT0320914.1 sigma-E factor regulatory protein RseB domain-containing protein [Streptomyces sp. DSM 44918]